MTESVGSRLVAVLAFAASVSPQQLGASGNERVSRDAGVVERRLEPLRYPTVSARRNPFARPMVDLHFSNANDLLQPAPVPQFDLPPNAGASDEAEISPTEQPVLRAVAIGESPKALVQLGDRTIVVGIGSHLGDSTIVSIDVRGAQLSDGSHLRLGNGRP